MLLNDVYQLYIAMKLPHTFLTTFTYNFQAIYVGIIKHMQCI
jgi:hypothetical protein